MTLGRPITGRIKFIPVVSRARVGGPRRCPWESLMSWIREDPRPLRFSWRRSTPWILVVITIVFWLWFGIGSALVEGGGWFNWMMHILLPGGIFILSALIAWRWRFIGGFVFVVEGLVASGFLSVSLISGSLHGSTLLMMALTLALPPLAAGILFLLHSERSSDAS
jgi:hypothetical protein